MKIPALFPALLILTPFSGWAAGLTNTVACLPKPTPEQAAWQDAELGMFIHFDIEVFDPAFTHASNKWPGTPLGAIPAARFNPRKLNTDQWLAVAKALGAKYAVLTAKHGSGFLMWQSDLYPYGVKQSPWENGHGDVVRDFMASCKKYGIEPGIYCSAGGHSWWNLHHPKVAYRHGRISGDPQAVKNFIDMDLSMYRDLFRRTGPLFYIWLDGGVNPFGDQLAPILEQYEPHAVVFNGPAGGLAAGLARWSGNEKGYAPYPLWNTINTSNDQTDRGTGDPAGKFWIPVEGNAPLRYHVWIWKANDANKILSLSSLMTMYLETVGRGANFIVNANIGPDGLIPAPDARRLEEFGATIRRWFGRGIAQTNGVGDVLELRLPRPQAVNFVVIQEDIRQGQRIRSYQVDGLAGGVWTKLCEGQSVGHKRIQQFTRTKVSAIQLRVSDAAAEPVIRFLGVYNIHTPPSDPNNPALGY
ncbi:MAG: alpha-L-fucosidase [Verrucomicrobia bacterium]|nr:alpha-L-fucosidase [Verrucomicrobiota bacterium]MDE3098687.1 alpha-L-fucosidase [Verrucomicrobiota bacterium]